MPSFEVLIVGAPLGFTQGCRAISGLLKADAENFQALTRTAIGASKNIVENSSRHDFKEEFDALLYIFSSILHATPVISDSSEISNTLDMNTYLSKDAIQAIVAASESTRQAEAATAAVMSATNGIENFKWKIGVSIASSSCNNLMTPFVAISFDVKEKSGQLISHNVEMSYSEFQDFHRMFAQVSATMDAM